MNIFAIIAVVFIIGIFLKHKAMQEGTNGYIVEFECLYYANGRGWRRNGEAQVTCVNPYNLELELTNLLHDQKGICDPHIVAYRKTNSFMTCSEYGDHINKIDWRDKI